MGWQTRRLGWWRGWTTNDTKGGERRERVSCFSWFFACFVIQSTDGSSIYGKSIKEGGQCLTFNETIVRHFFELNGFLVRTNVKYWVSGKRGGGDSDIDLVVYNLNPDKLNPPQAFILTVDELAGIRQAIVETKGWHTESFTEGLIKNTPRIFN